MPLFSSQGHFEFADAVGFLGFKDRFGKHRLHEGKDTQEAIIDVETFERVQELRRHRRRNAATGRTSLFSGLVYCADCGSKLYFCASKSIKLKQEFHRCSAYKENRGTCSIHYIREVILKEIVLEAIQKTARYVQNL